MDSVRPSFELRAVVVEPGSARAYDETEWHDALVVVESGEIELECASGLRYRFVDGDILWLTGLPLLAFHNRGSDPVLLLAVSRADFWRRRGSH